MNHFCCEPFKFFYSGEKTMGLNIRIVKLSKEFIERARATFDKSYLITEGYVGDIRDCKKKMTINFCPFCGTRLKEAYNSDEFIQETINI